MTSDTTPQTGVRPVLVVPHYDHLAQFERALPGLLASGVPLLVVDDGSPPEVLERLEGLASARSFDLLSRPENRGKGDAVVAGFERADRQGFSHALQVDADGQHESGDIPRFLECARRRPASFVCGAPVFGEDAPWVRVWGRKITDAVVALETWSTGIRDSLCGFRVYPLAETLALLDRYRPGSRMDFDTEILVAARWHRLDLHFLDTQVRYPEDGRSHFRYLHDNLRLIALHVRLILGMMVRAPRLLADRLAGRGGQVTGD